MFHENPAHVCTRPWEGFGFEANPILCIYVQDTGLGSQSSIKLCMSLTWEIVFCRNWFLSRVLYNSRAVISDIGEGSSALYCLTDREECCSTHKCPGLPSVVLPVLKCPCVPGYPGMSQASRDVPGCPGMSQGSFSKAP